MVALAPATDIKAGMESRCELLPFLCRGLVGMATAGVAVVAVTTEIQPGAVVPPAAGGAAGSSLYGSNVAVIDGGGSLGAGTYRL